MGLGLDLLSELDHGLELRVVLLILPIQKVIRTRPSQVEVARSLLYIDCTEQVA